jgi:hypothetical protein
MRQTLLRPGDLMAAERVLAERLVQRVRERSCSIRYDVNLDSVIVEPAESLTVALAESLQAYAPLLKSHLRERDG